MEIRIGITQVARELMVEVSSDALVAKAREGSALHLLALQRISDQERERIRAECGDLPQPQAQPATVH